MDLLYIIKELKYVKTLVEFHLKPKPELKVQISHCLENLIDLDQILNETGHFENRSHINSIIDTCVHDETCNHKHHHDH